MGGSSSILAGYKSSSLSLLRLNENAFMARVWGDFNILHMKPFRTYSQPTLLENSHVCCMLFTTLLKIAQLLSQEDLYHVRSADSDSELFLACLCQHDQVERKEGADNRNTDS
ncbi:hypothetical protein KQX54_013958 [Cotesia glomerata]|uniref:Uncharacterized protein n=1 Tax=Cotesia glomerata TaxID=32391 RepID=A0AAV7J7X6_COTGL|nr:hypothetical protein KQX54_013958 [Cotesia glomerata]